MLKTYGGAVDKHNRVSAAVNFIVNLNTAVIYCGHNELLGDVAGRMFCEAEYSRYTAPVTLASVLRDLLRNTVAYSAARE
ncbi:hypothetical protein GCM10022414_15940 [Zhongshania borealis]|uniref:Uncharacterized protein n=1 Tax=Zhongshania borealis TaxID=889488 RepID=A0ABP7WNL5_9GAMM